MGVVKQTMIVELSVCVVLCIVVFALANYKFDLLQNFHLICQLAFAGWQKQPIIEVAESQLVQARTFNRGAES